MAGNKARGFRITLRPFGTIGDPGPPLQKFAREMTGGYIER